MNLTVLLLVLTAFSAAALLSWQFSRPKSRMYLLDHPNERSLHSQPTPRTGGVAIALALSLCAAIYVICADLPGVLLWIGLAAGLLAIMSFFDDRYGLPVGLRFLGHLLVAVLTTTGGLILAAAEIPGWTWLWPTWLAQFVTIIFLVWMINLYNFMDGMDGFAGGMAVIGFGVFALLGLKTGHSAFVVSNLLIMAASAGFLVFNFPPARIFMGDTGSSLLGLLSGAMMLWASTEGIFKFWTGLLVFSPFVVDATVTLLRRLFRGERVWEAHRSHFYQRLVQRGWGHRKTVLIEYVLMLACGGSALLASTMSVAWQQALLAGVIVVYLTLIYAVTISEPQRPSS